MEPNLNPTVICFSFNHSLCYFFDGLTAVFHKDKGQKITIRDTHVTFWCAYSNIYLCIR